MTTVRDIGGRERVLLDELLVQIWIDKQALQRQSSAEYCTLERLVADTCETLSAFEWEDLQEIPGVVVIVRRD